MKNNNWITALIAFAIVFAAQPSAFADPNGMQCWFTPVKAKTHEALIAAMPESFWMVYESIDIEEGSAKLVRHDGAADVRVIKDSEGLHFLERTSSSPIVTASHSRDVAIRVFAR